MTTIDTLRDLIAIDTTSAGSNLLLIEYVEDLLMSYGIESRRILDSTGNKANLLARVGPPDRPGIVLSAHTDVVPVAGQAWSSDPFTLTARDGRLYGRGTADMKGFLAAVLSALPRFAAADLTTPIYLALSYDEEVGGLGARDLVKALEVLPTPPRFCIVGEPTGMQVVTNHKGIGTYEVSVTGVERHSSLAPFGINAIEHASRLIVSIQDLAIDLAEHGPFEDGYVVPHSTVHVGTVAGGSALNIVPGHCAFEFEIRNLPSQDPSQILGRIQAAADELPADIRIDPIVFLPALSTAADAAVVAWANGLIEGSGLGKVTYGSEAGLFSDAGIPTVVLGPGDIAQAHQPDEYITVEQLALADRFVERLIDSERVTRNEHEAV